MSIEKYIKEFKTGQIIFNEGDPGEEMYVIKKGKVRIEINIKVGSTVTTKCLDEIEAGQFFGEMALIDDLPRTARATAIEETELVLLNKNRFYKLIEDSPEFAIKIVRRVSNRLKEANIKLKNLGSIKKKTNVIKGILKLSDEKKDSLSFKDFDEYLTNLTGDNPNDDELDKYLKGLHNKKVVDYENNIVKIRTVENSKFITELLKFFEEE